MDGAIVAGASDAVGGTHGGVRCGKTFGFVCFFLDQRDRSWANLMRVI